MRNLGRTLALTLLLAIGLPVVAAATSVLTGADNVCPLGLRANRIRPGSTVDAVTASDWLRKGRESVNLPNNRFLVTRWKDYPTWVRALVRPGEVVCWGPASLPNEPLMPRGYQDHSNLFYFFNQDLGFTAEASYTVEEVGTGRWVLALLALFVLLFALLAYLRGRGREGGEKKPASWRQGVPLASAFGNLGFMTGGGLWPVEHGVIPLGETKEEPAPPLPVANDPKPKLVDEKPAEPVTNGITTTIGGITLKLPTGSLECQAHESGEGFLVKMSNRWFWLREGRDGQPSILTPVGRRPRKRKAKA